MGDSASPIQGQFLRLSERREVAIYLRNRKLWIADFIDGRGELVEPELWFRFHCCSPGTRLAERRMLLDSGMPLSEDMVAKIEALHRAAGEEAGHAVGERS